MLTHPGLVGPEFGLLCAQWPLGDQKIKHGLSAKASRVSMQTDKQDGKCLTESSNKVVLAYEKN